MSAEGGLRAQSFAGMSSLSVDDQRLIDISTWKKVDSRTLGISWSKISVSSQIVMKALRREGFKAYLVGGCVRDMLLKKPPKDFDVITTANLKQIKKQFHRRAIIVGRRFPICVVHFKDSIVEVSSFETLARNGNKKEKRPSGCDEDDYVRCRDSLHRDFTINSLFFDPFLNIIYDYANGMKDLRSLKLRTLMPAKQSFTQDCARILRGLRIAARLGLSFSKKTETAMHDLSPSIKSLGKARLMMELNYMLSYGAAKPSLCLLQRFNLLQFLLPHVVMEQSARSPEMLMELFFSLDKLVTCDQPSHCSVWIGILAFHLALVNKPQDALIVWTFSSVLYHGEWKKGVEYARKNAEEKVNLVPEISEVSDLKSDEELAEKVSELASLVKKSIHDLALISKKEEKGAAGIFDVLVRNITSYKKQRASFQVDTSLLGKGDVWETRFVLGKIIKDTLSSRVVQMQKEIICHPFDHDEQKLEKVKKNKCMGRKKPMEETDTKHLKREYYNLKQEILKENQKVFANKACQDMNHNLLENKTSKEFARKKIEGSWSKELMKVSEEEHNGMKCWNSKQGSKIKQLCENKKNQDTSKMKQEVCESGQFGKTTEKKHQKRKYQNSEDEVRNKRQKVVGKCLCKQDRTQEMDAKKSNLILYEVEKTKKNKGLVKEKCIPPALSSLFK